MADNFLFPDFTLHGELTYFDFKPLNRGGYGITYVAKATYTVGRIKLTSSFAVKEFFPKTFATRNADGSVAALQGKEQDFRECYEEFLRECEMLRGLNHPGIVPVNEFIETNGTIYYVMSYLGDMNLTRYVSEHGGHLGEEEARRIMDKLIDSVGYLHGLQLNHLDIKPDNVMMEYDCTGYKHPVLIDFGVSKHFHANGKQTSRLGGKGVTDGFSPLEQYAGITTFSPKADIYALGATYFYMLTGMLPLKANELNEDWIRTNLPTDISQETADAICHAMKRDYIHRTARVADFFKKHVVPPHRKTQPIINPTSTKEYELVEVNDEGLKSIIEEQTVKHKSILNKVWFKYLFLGVLAVTGIAFLIYSLTDRNTIEWKGGVYKGNVENGVPQGEGKLRRNDMTYTGQWTNGELTKGRIVSSRFVYEGGIQDFMLHGYGVCWYNDGHTYHGYWYKDKKEGLGLINYPDENKMTFSFFSSGISQIPDGQDFQPGDMAYGIDVSRHQGNIKWQDLYMSSNQYGGVNGVLDASPNYIQPVLFAFVKATEGSDISDAKFKENFSEAKRCGILRGAYHFLSLRTSGKSQARNFIEHANLESGDFPPVLDLEKYESAQVTTTDEEFANGLPIAKEWLAEIESHYGVKPMIYTNLLTYNTFLKSDDDFSKYYYWIAAPGKTPPSIDHCIIWQFHHHGQVAGINDNYTDINKYLGSYSELKEFVKREGIK